MQLSTARANYNIEDPDWVNFSFTILLVSSYLPITETRHKSRACWTLLLTDDQNIATISYKTQRNNNANVQNPYTLFISAVTCREP